MVSTFTPNIDLEKPGRGDQVGVWDTPVNSNMSVIDTILGGISSIALNNTPVVLAAGQYQSGSLLFNSTLTGSVSITFPTSFVTTYEVQNVCTGTSAFIITLTTAVPGGQVIACPPGEIFEIRNDGVNLKFKNFGRIGDYWDYAGSSVPAWVSGCTIPPYLNCNGTTFLSTQYPALSIIMGSTPAPGRTVTLPDSRGRVRAILNQTTARMNSTSGGVDGDTLFAAGANEIATLGSSNLPHSIPFKDPTHQHQEQATVAGAAGIWIQIGSAAASPSSTPTANFTAFAGTGLTINPSTAAAGTDDPITTIQPTYIGGLTLIRAA